MKNYEIHIGKDMCVVIATSYENPMDSVPEIQADLNNSKYSGEVYFDLLFKNGFARNRFIKVNFINSKFDHESFRAIKTMPDSVFNITKSFYIRNESLFKNSVLTKMQQMKYLGELKNGK